MKPHLFLFLTLVSLFVKAQDTVKVMQYNLLNYGNTTSYCTTTNNNIDDKNGYMREIIGFVLPDILAVEEIHGTTIVVDGLLNNALNQDGRTYYQHANITNYSGSDIVNMLYYDARKFTLYWQYAISTSLRDINLYTLYYNSPDLSTLHDTAFLNVMVLHLKAGSYSSDAQTRADMTAALMNYLDVENVTGNNLVFGDFNVYSSSEEAFQNLVNYTDASLRFYDPVNQLGAWNNNSSFADYHTQSTHTDNDNCHASGGLDDRFDFILISNEVKNDLFKVKYVQGSYETVAQDGNHFNSSLLDSPTNYSVPSMVLSSLYANSDHLPVILKLRINQTPALGIHDLVADDFNFSVNNPVDETIRLSFGYHTKVLTVQLFSVLGKLLLQDEVEPYAFQKDITVSSLSQGVYFLKVSDGKMMKIKKLVVH